MHPGTHAVAGQQVGSAGDQILEIEQAALALQLFVIMVQSLGQNECGAGCLIHARDPQLLRQATTCSRA